MFVETTNNVPPHPPNYGHGGGGVHSSESSTIPSDDDFSRESSASAMSHGDSGRASAEGSPMMMSPWNNPTPFSTAPDAMNCPQYSLLGSIVREEGHIYSLAASGDLLYTGSDSKNIRVWKNLKEFSGFKSSSGLIKAIILSGGKVYTGHQDGKIRIWKVNKNNPASHKRSGTLPTLKDIIKCSVKPKNYVEVRRRRTAIWIKHTDAVSCLSISEDEGLLYSASWDATVKVWRLSDYRCMESVIAHDDAVNSVVASLNGLVYTGSADGTVKVWKREVKGKSTKHENIQTLLKQESAVTAVAVNDVGSAVYCGSSDGVVNFWERAKELCHGGTLKGHKLAILCLAAVGSTVFSGSADKTICVWRRDGMTHTCLSILTGHAGPVKCLAVEKDPEPSDGNHHRWIVYSGSLDKSVKVWSVAGHLLDGNSKVLIDADSSPDASVSSRASRNR